MERMMIIGFVCFLGIVALYAYEVIKDRKGDKKYEEEKEK